MASEPKTRGVVQVTLTVEEVSWLHSLVNRVETRTPRTKYIKEEVLKTLDDVLFNRPFEGR